MSLTDFSPYHTTFAADRPYEREYEGWITRGMEDYFRELGLEFECMVVSPSVEKKEALDQFCRFKGKYFGLQIKRPQSWRVGAGNGLLWPINKPLGQHKKLADRKDIFYALPTTLNRALRRVVLQHVLFWRPGLEDGERLFVNPSKSRVHYPEGTSTNSNLSEAQQRAAFRLSNKATTSHAYRWGRFVERLLDCRLGATELGDIDQFKAAIATLMEAPPNNEVPIRLTMIVVRIGPLSA